MREIMRGDIYYAMVDKRRPVVVISNNKYNTTSQYVTVCPIASSVKRLDLPCHVLLSADITGEKSMVMCEHYYTVKKCDLNDYVGTLSKFQMKKINKAVKCQLALGE